jgi:hypothetical protein
MNVPIEFESGRRLSMPAQFGPLLKPPRLLPGECQTDYDTISQMMIEEVAPQTGIEWLWTIDLIELSWDVVRYRSLREAPQTEKPYTQLAMTVFVASRPHFQCEPP